MNEKHYSQHGTSVHPFKIETDTEGVEWKVFEDGSRYPYDRELSLKLERLTARLKAKFSEENAFQKQTTTKFKGKSCGGHYQEF